MKRKIEPISFRSRDEESEPLNQSTGSDKKCTEIKYKLGILDYFIIGLLLIAAVIVISVQIYMFVLRSDSNPPLSWLKVLSPLMAFFCLPVVIAIAFNTVNPYEIRSIIAAVVGIVSFSLFLFLLLLSRALDEEMSIGTAIFALPACLVIFLSGYAISAWCFSREKIAKPTWNPSEPIII
jgi:hypothetical protein